MLRASDNIVNSVRRSVFGWYETMCITVLKNIKRSILLFCETNKAPTRTYRTSTKCVLLGRGTKIIIISSVKS